TGASVERERLRDIDLHMVNEVPVPDWLEQSVSETKRQDVLRRLLPQEMVDAKDLVLGEDLVQPGVQRNRACEVSAERLFHDDPRPLDELGFSEQLDDPQGGVGRYAQVVQSPTVATQGLPGLLHRPQEGTRAGGEGDIVQGLREGGPIGLTNPADAESMECLPRHRTEAIGVEVIPGHADDPAPGNEPGPRELEQAGQKLPLRQVPGGAHQDDNLRIFRSDTRRDSTHVPVSQYRRLRMWGVDALHLAPSGMRAMATALQMVHKIESQHITFPLSIDEGGSIDRSVHGTVGAGRRALLRTGSTRMDL